MGWDEPTPEAPEGAVPMRDLEEPERAAGGLVMPQPPPHVARQMAAGEAAEARAEQDRIDAAQARHNAAVMAEKYFVSQHGYSHAELAASEQARQEQAEAMGWTRLGDPAVDVGDPRNPERIWPDRLPRRTTAAAEASASRSMLSPRARLEAEREAWEANPLIQRMVQQAHEGTAYRKSAARRAEIARLEAVRDGLSAAGYADVREVQHGYYTARVNLVPHGPFRHDTTGQRGYITRVTQGPCTIVDDWTT